MSINIYKINFYRYGIKHKKEIIPILKDNIMKGFVHLWNDKKYDITNIILKYNHISILQIFKYNLKDCLYKYIKRKKTYNIDICSICLDNEKKPEIYTHCNHSYCYDCLYKQTQYDQIKKKDTQCGICRRVIKIIYLINN